MGSPELLLFLCAPASLIGSASSSSAGARTRPAAHGPGESGRGRTRAGRRGHGAARRSRVARGRRRARPRRCGGSRARGSGPAGTGPRFTASWLNIPNAAGAGRAGRGAQRSADACGCPAAPTGSLHGGLDYMLEGELLFQVEDALVTAAGEPSFAPRNLAHTLANHSDAPARYLLICTPAGFERHWARTAAQAARDRAAAMGAAADPQGHGRRPADRGAGLSRGTRAPESGRGGSGGTAHVLGQASQCHGATLKAVPFEPLTGGWRAVAVPAFSAAGSAGAADAGASYAQQPPRGARGHAQPVRDLPDRQPLLVVPAAQHRGPRRVAAARADRRVSQRHRRPGDPPAARRPGHAGCARPRRSPAPAARR